MPATVDFDMRLTTAPLLFGAAVQVVDEDGTVVVYVDAAQHHDDPEGVFEEMRRHMRVNSRAYKRPSHVKLIRPRPALEAVDSEVV